MGIFFLRMEKLGANLAAKSRGRWHLEFLSDFPNATAVSYDLAAPGIPKAERKLVLPNMPLLDKVSLVKGLKTATPAVWNAKPSTLLLLSTVYDELQEAPPTPNLIITSGESLSYEVRGQLQKIFNAQVYNLYAIAEVGNVAFECSNSRGMHVLWDHTYVEIIRDGRQVALGDSGEIVVTSLVNRAMPLIRYRTGDVGRFITNSCHCGFGGPELEIEHGRIVYYFQRQGGTLYNPHVMEKALAQCGFLQYQVRQCGYDRIEFRYLAKENCCNIREAVSVIKGICGDVHVEIQPMSTFEPTTLKRSNFVSELPNPFLSALIK